MSRIKELKEKLANKQPKKPKLSRARQILEEIKKAKFVEFLSPEEVTDLKKKVKNVLPTGWKGSFSWSVYSGGKLTLKVRELPLKDAKEMAYKDFDNYKKVNGLSSLQAWNYKEQMRLDCIDIDNKVINNSFEIYVQPTSPGKIEEKDVISWIRTKINPESQIAKKLVKVICIALNKDYNKSDPMPQYLDRTHCIKIMFGCDKKTKLS